MLLFKYNGDSHLMEVGGLFMTKKNELISYALHKGRNWNRDSRFVRKQSPIFCYHEGGDGGPLAPEGPLLAKSPDFRQKAY